MQAPIDGPLVITQLHASLRGGSGEAYHVWHDGALYHCIGHAGVDINCPTGTAVRAMKAGVLTIAPHDPWSGGYAEALGIYAVVALPAGETHTYAHLSEVLVPDGATVAAGQIIAHSGATGNVTGPHLHLGVRPPRPDYANGFDGTIACLTHFDHDVVLDLHLV